MFPFSVRILQNSVARILTIIVSSNPNFQVLSFIEYTIILIPYSLPFSLELLQVRFGFCKIRIQIIFFGSTAKELIPLVSSKVLLTLLSHMQLLKTGTSFQIFENPFYCRMVPRQATLQLHSAQLRNKKVVPNLD